MGRLERDAAFFAKFRYLSLGHGLMSKKLTLVFILSFVLNLVWEFLSSALYSNHQGGKITSLILFEATATDAGMILMLVFIAPVFKFNKSLFVVLGGLVLSIIIEIWALRTGSWAYNSLMPIVPIINIGLAPAVQLSVTGYIAKRMVFGNG